MTMKPLYVAAAAVFAIGCAPTDYSPVEQVAFDRIPTAGCEREGDRFSTTALINSATRETIVLWDGRRAEQTVAVTLPRQGVASRVGEIIGESRYQVAVDELNELREARTPVAVTMLCRREGLAPEAYRFRYEREDGRTAELEF
jgi:hypothetical protein